MTKFDCTLISRCTTAGCRAISSGCHTCVLGYYAENGTCHRSSEQPCHNPGNIAHGSLSPSVEVYQYGSRITYTCDTDFKLVNGKDSHEGRVEVLMNNKWGTVCDKQFGQNEADMICRSMRSVYAGAIWFKRAVSAGIAPGGDTRWLTQFQCQHDSYDLDDCAYSDESCSHSQDVAIRCYHKHSFPTSYIWIAVFVGLAVLIIALIWCKCCCCTKDPKQEEAAASNLTPHEALSDPTIELTQTQASYSSSTAILTPPPYNEHYNPPIPASAPPCNIQNPPPYAETDPATHACSTHDLHCQSLHIRRKSEAYCVSFGEI